MDTTAAVILPQHKDPHRLACRPYQRFRTRQAETLAELAGLTGYQAF